jgi:hypothetical protein
VGLTENEHPIVEALKARIPREREKKKERESETEKEREK